jgi:hypothetical protein
MKFNMHGLFSFFYGKINFSGFSNDISSTFFHTNHPRRWNGGNSHNKCMSCITINKTVETLLLFLYNSSEHIALLPFRYFSTSRVQRNISPWSASINHKVLFSYMPATNRMVWCGKFLRWGEGIAEKGWKLLFSKL